jgi:hypothetical protein
MIFNVGKVTGYLPLTKVAVLKLTSDISISDKLIFTGVDEKKFGQKQNLIRIENNRVDFAKTGTVVAIAVSTPVLINSFVFKDV